MTSDGRPPLDRRALARALSAAADMSAREALADLSSPYDTPSHIVALTGAPGVGKSSLTGALAEHRLAGGRRIGILAIDPTSRTTGGAILGDRIRMEERLQSEDLYLRSLGNRHSGEGMTDNIVDIAAVMDRFGFDEVMLETVGVGQTDTAVRRLADTVVLVLMPGAGDYVQAMKAGVMEMADIFVVNKADMDGADRLVSEITNIAGRATGTGWTPPVLTVSARTGQGVAAFSQAVDDHRAFVAGRALEARRAVRTRARIAALLHRRLDEILEAQPTDSEPGDLVRTVLETLSQDAGHHGRTA